MENIFELNFYRGRGEDESTEEFLDEDRAERALNRLEQDGGTKTLVKRTAKYEFIGELDKEYEQTIEDFPVEDFYNDKSVYKLIDEGEEVDVSQTEEQSSSEIEKIEKDKAEEVLKKVVRYFKEKYPIHEEGGLWFRKSFYFIVPIEGTNKSIELRISNHSGNPNNIDSKSNIKLESEIVRDGNEPKKIDTSNEDLYEIDRMPDTSWSTYYQVRPKNRVAILSNVIFYKDNETRNKFDDTDYPYFEVEYDLNKTEYSSEDIIESINEDIEVSINKNKDNENAFAKGGIIPENKMIQYKQRTAFINKKLMETPDEETKRLLSNGFIPDSLVQEFEDFKTTYTDTAESTDIDKISNANYFGINPDKVAGKVVPGSGFLNPVLVKGNINDAVKTIDDMLEGTVSKTETVEPESEIDILKNELNKMENLMANPRFTGDITADINKIKSKIEKLENPTISKAAQETIKPEWDKMKEFINETDNKKELPITPVSENAIEYITRQVFKNKSLSKSINSFIKTFNGGTNPLLAPGVLNYSKEQLEDAYYNDKATTFIKNDKDIKNENTVSFFIEHFGLDKEKFVKTVESILPKTNNTEGWMQTQSEYLSAARINDSYPEKDAMWERNQIGNHSKEVTRALNINHKDYKLPNGNRTDVSEFAKAIYENKLSATKAKEIIESAGITVPNEIKNLLPMAKNSAIQNLANILHKTGLSMHDNSQLGQATSMLSDEDANTIRERIATLGMSEVFNELKNTMPTETKTDKEFEPTIEITSSELQLIVANGLLDEPKERKFKRTVAETLKLYNKGISENEIKAWVFHKRKYGNPMKGWENYFITGTGAGESILLITKQETTVKDNAFRDLRVVPAGVTIGVKTKFKNEYRDEKLVICKTEQGELLWVNTAHVKEQKNTSTASQTEIDKLVQDRAMIFDGNDYSPYPVFLFGNIYEKIDLLKENEKEIIAKYGKEVADGQIAQCEIYKPKLKSFRDPVKSNRPHILSLSAFATDWVKFGIKELNEEVNVRLGYIKRNRFIEATELMSLFDAFEQWLDQAVKDTEIKNTTKANIKKYYFANSIRWEKDSDGKDVLTTAQKDELIGNARIAAEDLFSEFLATSLTFEDSVALDAIWNKKYNAFSNIIQFVDKIPVAYDGSAMFKNGDLDIKPAQRQGLAYLQLVGSGCLAYDVGFGKTLTGILNLAQLVSQGAVKRPLVVVPKPTYKNWLKELFGYWTDGEKVMFEEFEGAIYHYGVFSGTNIKVNDWYNLSGEHYKGLLSEKHGSDVKGMLAQQSIGLNELVSENTITVVSYKGFEQMGFSRNVSTEMFDSISRVLMQKEATDDPKETAKLYEKIQGWLGVGNKNSLIDVDVCGFDHLTVDEAHNFKNVFESCGKDPETKRKLFGISAGQSSRAVKMFFISNYIQLKHGKNVVLLTATPFTNSPLEIYSMLSFIGLESLNKYNLFNIKKFFEQFVLETIEYSIDAKGEIITKPVIKSFMNLKLLQTILYNHFHYKDNPKEANVVRPCLIELPNNKITTYLDMNDWQIKNQQLVKAMAKSVSRTNPGAMLKAISMSLNNAFSPFLFAKEQPESAEDFVEKSPKIKFAIECIRTVKEWHEGRGETCSGNIMYANRGKEYFDYIKQYLQENVGFKTKVLYDDEYLDEVEIILGGGGEDADDRKELIKDAYNAGIVKVIIGTSTIREGLNLQTRTSGIHNLYPEWNPTDVLQLKGRGWRQGNMFGYMRFVTGLVLNSMDGFIMQKQDEKSKRISTIWHSLGDSNISENTSDLDPSEIKMELVDDANEKFKIKYAAIITDIKRDLSILEENKKMMTGIENDVVRIREGEEKLYGKYADKKKQWVDYLAYLKTISIKKLKEAELKKTIENIERGIKNTTELINAFDKYAANRNEIPLAIAVYKMIEQRSFDVFTDYSTMGSEIKNKISSITDYWTFVNSNHEGMAYSKMVDSYSVLKKAEKSVLLAYGKAWYDDISDIQADITSKMESLTAKQTQVESTEYQEGVLNEIQAEMDAKKLIRGNLQDQVNKFASLNHILSYLSDNTDREGCPVPTEECCVTNGIDIVYQDKSIPVPGTTPGAMAAKEKEQTDTAAKEKKTKMLTLKAKAQKQRIRILALQTLEKAKTGAIVNEGYVIANHVAGKATKAITGYFDSKTGINTPSWTENKQKVYVYKTKQEAENAETELIDGSFLSAERSEVIKFSEF